MSTETESGFEVMGSRRGNWCRFQGTTCSGPTKFVVIDVNVDEDAEISGKEDIEVSPYVSTSSLLPMRAVNSGPIILNTVLNISDMFAQTFLHSEIDTYSEYVTVKTCLLLCTVSLTNEVVLLIRVVQQTCLKTDERHKLLSIVILRNQILKFTCNSSGGKEK